MTFEDIIPSTNVRHVNWALHGIRKDPPMKARLLCLLNTTSEINLYVGPLLIGLTASGDSRYQLEVLVLDTDKPVINQAFVRLGACLNAIYRAAAELDVTREQIDRAIEHEVSGLSLPTASEIDVTALVSKPDVVEAPVAVAKTLVPQEDKATGGLWTAVAYWHRKGVDGTKAIITPRDGGKNHDVDVHVAGHVFSTNVASEWEAKAAANKVLDLFSDWSVQCPD